MDVVPFFFWSFVGFSSFGQGNPFRLEGLFCRKEEEGGVAIGTVMFVLGYMEGQKFNCFRGLRAVHSKAESIFCVFIVVGNQIVDKRWSFDLNRFYRVGVYALRERIFFLFFPLLYGPFCKGVSSFIL